MSLLCKKTLLSFSESCNHYVRHLLLLASKVLRDIFVRAVPIYTPFTVLLLHVYFAFNFILEGVRLHALQYRHFLSLLLYITAGTRFDDVYTIDFLFTFIAVAIRGLLAMTETRLSRLLIYTPFEKGRHYALGR